MHYDAGGTSGINMVMIVDVIPPVDVNRGDARTGQPTRWKANVPIPVRRNYIKNAAIKGTCLKETQMFVEQAA